MGQEIVYCFKCLTRLTGGDFEKGKAFRQGPRVACKDCLPDLLAGLSPQEREQVQRGPPDRGTSASLPAIRPSTTRRRSEESPAPSGKGKAAALALGGGAVLLLVVGLVLLRPEPAAPAPPEPGTPPPPAPVAESEGLRRARKAVEKARDPSVTDAEVRLALWTEAVKASRGTPLHDEALDAERALIERRMADRARELGELDDAARPLSASGEPGKAAAVYEAARARHAQNDWGTAISERVAAVRREAAESRRELTEDAIQAVKAGDAARAREIEEAVARLGFPELLGEHKAALAGVKPPAKPAPAAPPSAEMKAFREGWMKAVVRAAARDFEGALAEHAAAARELKEEAVKAEAKRDQEDLVRLKELWAEAAKVGLKLALGRDLAFEVFDDEGRRAKVQGKLLRAWPGRVELAGEPSVFVELGDLTAGALADALTLTRKLSTTDTRALAVLCAAEGDGARAGKLNATLPAKTKELAKDGAARIPKRSPKEREARSLFYEAERAHRDPATRARAVLAYRKLAGELAETALVKGEAELVRSRAEEGREAFVTPGLFKPAGSFKPWKDEKLGAVWSSAEDVEKAHENYLEFEFLAVGDAAYKAWVYAGGCCGEVFSFSLQASDLAGPKAASAAPGSDTLVPVRHGVSSVKAKHEDHLGPKSPKKWAWIALPLPKFPEGGVKRVRVLTNQKGFSVGAAFVSSLRASPLSDAEVRERLERAKEASPDPALLAWCRLDEPGPDFAARGAVEWVKDGKVGGAARLVNGAWVEIPHQPSLNAFPITVSAWVRTTSDRELMGLVNKYVRYSSNGWSLLVHKGRARAWYFRDDKNKVHTDGLDGGLVNDGAWHHLALVVDAEEGRIFVDGVRKAAIPWTGTAGPATTGQSVSVGRYPGAPGDGKLDGSVDDVRIFARALSDPELRQLYMALGGELVEARPWSPLFNGTASFLHNPGNWNVEDGAITKVAPVRDSAQSRAEVEDGEFRFKLETSGVTGFWIAVRQGSEGKATAEWKGNVPDGTHEVVFVCAGDDIQATIDGKPVKVAIDGRPRRGRIQFNYTGKTLRVLAVDQRPPASSSSKDP